MGAKEYKSGRCHACGEVDPLTLEHIPPQSAGNNRWTVCHNLYGLAVGAKASILPPVLDCRRGMGRYSLCVRCNGWTAKHYNDAFADWTFQALEYAGKVGSENVVALPFRIKPLHVLKQVATMALAVAPFGDTPTMRRLRRFALYPFEPYLPPDFDIRAYLNPARAGHRQKKVETLNRMTETCAILDVSNGSVSHIVAEIAFPPMGYVVLFRNPQRLTDSIAELESISFFGESRYTEQRAIVVSLPVRAPFGPVPGHYPRF